ncbi:MAG: endonuclease NucS domain-containing protein [Patescibacteria group bacterium]|mgnify:CR=1 FL=1
MPIYKLNQNKVTKCSIKDDGFGDEFHLRDLFADNLEELIGVRLIAKEYSTPDGRIDTLGLDENNSPVIIEYKWKENEEVLAQGLFYFNWLITNKKHFELLVGKQLGNNIKVNWDQPRVILVAQGFGRYIIGAVQQEKHIELITYTFYQPDILHLETIYMPPEVKKVTKKHQLEDVREYNLDYHLQTTSRDIQQKFNSTRSKILELPGVEERAAQKSGVTYKTTKSFVRFEFRPTWIQVLLRDPEYKTDIKHLVKDVTSNDWGYKGMIKLLPDSDVDYVFGFIKQSYDSTI